VIPYSTNLFYEPIPFEMLKTYETKPQLLVSVGDLPAVCHNLTCDFTYTAPIGEITAFTFDAATNQVVITGTDFPTAVEDIRNVKFAKSTCVVDAATLTATNIECTLAREPTCGSYIPKVTAKLGKIPHVSTIVEEVVDCTITDALPIQDLNLLGGDNITITGTNFPHDLEHSVVSISFDDTQATTCVPQISSTTELVCLTSEFDITASAGASLAMTVTINGQVVVVPTSLSFTFRTTIKSGTTLNPNSVSPVLKTQITINLESTFPHALAREDFLVNATLSTNSTIIKRMRVVSVDDTAKTITAMFGGAESGIYQVSIRHAVEGLVGSTSLTLNVGSTVTNVSPKIGSIYGGTVLTITGTNFGT